MSDQIILNSVGSYLDTNGHVGPLDANGLPDLQEPSVDLSDVDAGWVTRLSTEDGRLVYAVTLMEIRKEEIKKTKEEES